MKKSDKLDSNDCFDRIRIADYGSNVFDQSNQDFEGYDTDYMDALIRNAKRSGWEEPKPSSGYTATLSFDLSTQEGLDAWNVHKQAQELYSLAFEVLYNLIRNFERAYESDPDADPVDILSSLICELSENHTLNVN